MKFLNLSKTNFIALKAEELERREQLLLRTQLLKQNCELREAHDKSLNEMEEMKKFQSSTFDTCKTKISRGSRYVFWNYQAEYRNCRTKLIAWMIQEIVKMLNLYPVEIPTLPVN